MSDSKRPTKRARDEQFETGPPTQRTRIILQEYFVELGQELKIPNLNEYVHDKIESYFSGTLPEQHESGRAPDDVGDVNEQVASSMELDPTELRTLSDGRDRRFGA